MSNNLTTTPLVSVIVNCLNGERYLKKSLDSTKIISFLSTIPRTIIEMGAILIIS